MERSNSGQREVISNRFGTECDYSQIWNLLSYQFNRSKANGNSLPSCRSV